MVTPISAEDKQVFFLRYDKRVGIALLTLLILIAIADPLRITSAYISDTDPSTYVIMPLLMLPLLSLFTAKEKLVPDVQRRDLFTGAGIFALFVLAVAGLRFELSYLFVSYGVEMLLMPLFVVSAAILLFGRRNLSRFKALIAYPIVASPAVLMPVIKLNSSFAALNTMAIYNLLLLFAKNATYYAPMTIAANGYRIGIGESCIGIGILIAMAALLLPLAYFYEGKPGRKVLWVCSGVVLLLVLNFARMLGIAAAWLGYGPNAATSLIHSFAGIVLFYASIIVIILLSGRYGLRVTQVRAETVKRRKAVQIGAYQKAGIVLSLIFGAAYFLMYLGYPASMRISPTVLAASVPFNFNNSGVMTFAKDIAGSGNFMSIIESMPGGGSGAVLFTNATINTSEPMVAYIIPQNVLIVNQVQAKNRIISKSYFVGQDGVSAGVYNVDSNGTAFMAYLTDLPVDTHNGTSTTARVFIVIPSSEMGNSTCGYSGFYTDLANAEGLNFNNVSSWKRLLSAYCIMGRVV